MISRHDVAAVQDVKDAATYLLKDKPAGSVLRA
jgi:hypothetical protein